MKPEDILIAITAALILGAVLGKGVFLDMPFSSEKMNQVLSETSNMSASKALQAFHEAGISDSYLAQILNSSRRTIRRLRMGGEPTPSMSASILGLYSNFLLFGRSRFLFVCRFSRGYDQWYAFMNPQQELPDSSHLKLSLTK